MPTNPNDGILPGLAINPGTYDMNVPRANDTHMITVTPVGEPHIVAVNFTPAALAVNDSLNVSITVKNDSAATVATQGPDSGLVYQEGESFFTRGSPEVAGAVRVGVDFDGRSGVDHPYRWGLRAPLAPGESRTVTGAIKLTSQHARHYWAGAVQERVAWWTDRSGVTAIQVGAKVKPRVVHVQDEHAANWVDQADYWNHVNQPVVDDMIARGMMALTGAAPHVPGNQNLRWRFARTDHVRQCRPERAHFILAIPGHSVARSAQSGRWAARRDLPHQHPNLQGACHRRGRESGIQ